MPLLRSFKRMFSGETDYVRSTNVAFMSLATEWREAVKLKGPYTKPGEDWRVWDIDSDTMGGGLDQLVAEYTSQEQALRLVFEKEVENIRLQGRGKGVHLDNLDAYVRDRLSNGFRPLSPVHILNNLDLVDHELLSKEARKPAETLLPPPFAG